MSSYRYWTLLPDQAEVDEKKSPEDPVVVAKNLIGSNSTEGRRSGESTYGGIEQNLETGQKGREVNDSPV